MTFGQGIMWRARYGSMRCGREIFCVFVFLIVLLFCFLKKSFFELLRNARLISEEKKFILVIPEIFVILWYRGGKDRGIERFGERRRKKERERERDQKKVYVYSTLWSPGVILKETLFSVEKKRKKINYWLLNIKCREISVMFFGWYTSAIAKAMWTEKKSIRNFMSMFGVVWYIVRGARLFVSGKKIVIVLLRNSRDGVGVGMGCWAIADRSVDLKEKRNV